MDWMKYFDPINIKLTQYILRPHKYQNNLSYSRIPHLEIHRLNEILQNFGTLSKKDRFPGILHIMTQTKSFMKEILSIQVDLIYKQ
jgi:hypothetical protein